MQKSTPFSTIDRPTDTTNEAGGKSYVHGPEETLARLACTGFFGDTYYASAGEQVKQVTEWAGKCKDEFLSDLAIYARKSAFMKDIPAALLAILHSRKTPEALEALDRAFPFVVDNGRMLRGFVQMVRSGVFGRKSLGHHVRRLVGKWVTNRPALQLWDDAIGNNPSMVDVIKLSHFKPKDKARGDLIKYLMDSSVVDHELPAEILEFEGFKSDVSRELPKVSFQRLTALDLSVDHWAKIALNMTWTQLRMNLNTLLRHKVFEEGVKQKAIALSGREMGMLEVLAIKLRDRESIRKSKVFPYQIFTAFKHIDPAVPMSLKLALQDALEVATENVPGYNMKVTVCVDSSGSMTHPISGDRGSVSSKISCNEVAGLIAATILRTNHNARIISFDTEARVECLNPRDSIATNAKILNRNGGGTDCGSPIELMNKWEVGSDLVIMVSDNESWKGYENSGNCWHSERRQSTTLLQAWTKFKYRNPKAKLVLIDLQACATSQAPKDQKDVLFVGGFSDGVFEAIGRWLKGDGSFVQTVKDFANTVVAERILQRAVTPAQRHGI